MTQDERKLKAAKLLTRSLVGVVRGEQPSAFMPRIFAFWKPGSGKGVFPESCVGLLGPSANAYPFEKA